MKDIVAFSDYMADGTRVSAIEREKIDLRVRSIGKLIEAREKKGARSLRSKKSEHEIDKRIHE